ncbi:MAG: hypothetical protein NZ701_04565 [Roseiflexus sp.]|nr:hypothetical protein [Roseiflexus sp.]
MANPGFPDRVEPLAAAGSQPEDDRVRRWQVRYRFPAAAPALGALDALALALCAAVNLDDLALHCSARRQRVAFDGECGQPGGATAFVSAGLRRHTVLHGGDAVWTRGAAAKGLHMPGDAGDARHAPLPSRLAPHASRLAPAR